jgi:hypothetical protein
MLLQIREGKQLPEALNPFITAACDKLTAVKRLLGAPLTVGEAFLDPRMGKAPHFARIRLLPTESSDAVIFYWHLGQVHALFPSGVDEVITAGALANSLRLPCELITKYNTQLEEPCT